MNVKNLIGTIIIALLVVALSVGMAAAYISIAATDINGFEKQHFAYGETVYSSGAGLSANPGPNGTVYVVENTTWDDGDPIGPPHATVVLSKSVNPADLNNGVVLLATVGAGPNDIPGGGYYDVV